MAQIRYIKKLDAKIIETIGQVIHGVSSDRSVQYKSSATPQNIIDGDAIATGAETMTVVANGNTITATMDVSDTSIEFDVWDDVTSALQFRQTVAAVAGVADYTLDAMPGLYLIRAYGTISLTSGFIEVTV